jgi:hypothetical protein
MQAKEQIVLFSFRKLLENRNGNYTAIDPCAKMKRENDTRLRRGLI